MIEQLHREGIAWKPTATPEQIADAIEMLAGREVGEEDFIAWLRGQVST